MELTKALTASRGELLNIDKNLEDPKDEISHLKADMSRAERKLTMEAKFRPLR